MLPTARQPDWHYSAVMLLVSTSAQLPRDGAVPASRSCLVHSIWRCMCDGALGHIPYDDADHHSAHLA